ncbi:Heat shock protein 9/12 family protein [Candida parapsilosis]|uniref:Heat shock protein 9/12 family protein n=1 Tax=Candida parapsilosis TaxID=5480 RepID=A0A8X7TD46_CANPA|nr:Heat shock protein 9/12 family protein [Candida parapsilosis]KAF6056140.1 Heat shock protein 9/12 family protein [Candida parapsilosis]KAF6059072.1 Heat shock protein 9/12 family protein [Candida parapsilosis]KAF6067829.1 Heat shock protein 9/12 family protein [Candida parapsilosis]
MAGYDAERQLTLYRVRRRRKDLGDKVESKVKPDSQKSTFEQAKDKVTDAVDSLAGKGTSENDKSATQSASDAVFGDK